MTLTLVLILVLILVPVQTCFNKAAMLSANHLGIIQNMSLRPRTGPAVQVQVLLFHMFPTVSQVLPQSPPQPPSQLPFQPLSH